MAINYHHYSVKRKAIMQQVRRVEQKHFKVAEKYHLPTVNELKKMPISKQRNIIKKSSGFTTKAVSKSAYAYAGISTKSGKLKKIKVKYDKYKREKKSKLKKRKWKPHDNLPPREPPHIRELMEEKIRAIISKYNMLNSNIGRRIENWLDDANQDGEIDRLSSFTEDMLDDLDFDIRYLSQGKIPKGDGINALHWALTSRGTSAELWQEIQDDMEVDVGATRFDEESFNGDYDE